MAARPRIVDARHDVLDAERLARHPGDQHVGVVAVGHRGERRGLFDARLDESVPVEPDALDGLSLEIGAEPGEGFAAPIDDGDGVPGVEDGVGQRGPNPPAPDDHHVHGAEHTFAGSRGEELRDT